MTNLGAFFLAVAIFFLGFAIDNGLTNISRALALHTALHTESEKKDDNT